MEGFALLKSYTVLRRFVYHGQSFLPGAAGRDVFTPSKFPKNACDDRATERLYQAGWIGLPGAKKRKAIDPAPRPISAGSTSGGFERLPHAAVEPVAENDPDLSHPADPGPNDPDDGLGEALPETNGDSLPETNDATPGAEAASFVFDPATMDIQHRGNGHYFAMRDDERLHGPMTDVEARPLQEQRAAWVNANG